MKITYDEQADALYIYFGEGKVAASEEVSDGVVVDYDADRHLVGIEVLFVSRRMPALDLDTLTLDRIGGERGTS